MSWDLLYHQNESPTIEFNMPFKNSRARNSRIKKLIASFYDAVGKGSEYPINFSLDKFTTVEKYYIEINTYDLRSEWRVYISAKNDGIYSFYLDKRPKIWWPGMPFERFWKEDILIPGKVPSFISEWFIQNLDLFC